MNTLNLDEDAVLAERPMPPGTGSPASAAPNTTQPKASEGAATGPGAPVAGSSAVSALDLGKLLGELIGTTCNKLIAPKRGPHWALTAGEQSMLGDAYGAVLNKYFPDASFGVEVTAIICTGLVFGPRIATDRKLRREPTADAPTGAQAPPENTGSQDAIPGKKAPKKAAKKPAKKPKKK